MDQLEIPTVDDITSAILILGSMFSRRAVNQEPTYSDQSEESGLLG